MPTVVYIQPDGAECPVDVAVGDSVMDGAVDHGVAGILGQCGGGVTCATCHCYVDAPWGARLPAPGADEAELLTYVLARQKSSRLACQIRITEALAGLRVRVPRDQL